jgi:streptogramin lyase
MKVTLFTMPKKPSAPRRGFMDDKDRMWFGEYRGNRMAMFDTKTETFKQWDMPTAWSNPYDVHLDKNGEAWTGSMLNDACRGLIRRPAPCRASAAEDHQHPPRVHRECRRQDGVLGRLEPRRQHHQAGGA